MSWSDEVTGTQLDLSQASADSGWACTMLERFLAGVSYGHIKIVLPSGQVTNKQGVHPGSDAIILIRNWRMLRRMIAEEGTINVGLYTIEHASMPEEGGLS